MNIQKQAFEKAFKQTEIYVREVKIRKKDILEYSTKFGYFSIVANDAWNMWQQAQKVAVPEGFVLMPEDQAKDTERLNFLICGNSCIRTVVKRDIENEDYEKTGEHFLFTEVYWIDGWDYHANTSSQSERGAIDKAMIEAQEQTDV